MQGGKWQKSLLPIFAELPNHFTSFVLLCTFFLGQSFTRQLWSDRGKMSFSRASWNLFLSCDCMTWLQKRRALFSSLLSPHYFPIYSIIQVLELNQSGKHQMLCHHTQSDPLSASPSREQKHGATYVFIKAETALKVSSKM